VTVYDAATGNQLVQTSTSAFITAAGGMPSTKINDPYIDWNEFAQRWVVSIPTDLQDFVAVSASADPRGAWSGTGMTTTNHGDVTLKLAHDRNGEYLGEFEFDGKGVPDPNTGNFAWYCFAIPTTEMAWTGSFAPAHTNQHNCGYEVRPVMDHDPSKAASAPFYFYGRTCPAGGCQNLTNYALGVIVHRGVWNGTSVTFDSLGAGGSDRIASTGFLYNTPILAAQPSGAGVVMIETHRIQAAEQIGNIIHGAMGTGPCTSNCGSQGADTNNLLLYVAVDVSAYPTLSVAAQAKLSSSTLAYAYPGIATDNGGNIALTAMCSGSAQDMSLCAWGHGASDPAGSLHGPVVLFKGTQTYNCNAGTTVGTGTYANAVRDGADPTAMWMVEQDAESATSCQWTTRIAKLALH
jgi:hypothetical protein